MCGRVRVQRFESAEKMQDATCTSCAWDSSSELRALSRRCDKSLRSKDAGTSPQTSGKNASRTDQASRSITRADESGIHGRETRCALVSRVVGAHEAGARPSLHRRLRGQHACASDPPHGVHAHVGVWLLQSARLDAAQFGNVASPAQFGARGLCAGCSHAGHLLV